MVAPSSIVEWLFDEEVSVATLLGFLSIPFSVALYLDSGPSNYDIRVVTLAALLVGLYYSNRSTSVKRAGWRTGVIGGLPAVWNSVTIVASGWAISPGYGVLGIAFGSLWFLFALAVCGVGGVVSALIGSVIGRLPLFRRLGPQTA